MFRLALGRGFLIACMLLAGLYARAAEPTLIADAHVNAALPAVNSGALSNVAVGGGFTGLLQFDLSTLPAGTTAAQISRATLRLYVNRVDTAGSIAIQPLTSAWSEYGVTYATLPGMSPAVGSFAVTAPDGYVTIDVTALVQGWVSAPAGNFGVALTAAAAVAQFDSKENDLTGHPAALDVQIVSQGAQGVQGPKGDAGAMGAQGVAGATGAQGPAGPAGATGAAGPQGVSGLQGLPGATGPVGPTGPAGANGAAGAAGPQGVKGLPGLGFEGAFASSTNYGLDDVVSWQNSSYISLMASNHGNTPGLVPGAWALLAAAGVGTKGDTGAQGSVGPQGQIGPTGATGAQGPTGATGLQGAKGLPGLVYQGNYASTNNYALGDVVVWQGASWSSLVDGNHGNTPSLSPTYWGVLTTQGPTGATGATGLAGPTGAAGPLGPVGPPGERGDQGAQGIAGQAGAQGISGAKGDTGLSGPMGPQGSAGPVGLTWQGSYSSATNYALADAVLWQGSGYVSLVAGNHGNTPSESPAAWSLFAAAGSAGALGAVGPAGATGATGPAGPQGITGATGAPGVVGPQGPAVANFLGTYKSTANYGVADAVSYGGSTYISLAAGNHGNTPDQSPAYWSVLVQAGAAGVPGPAGPVGATGAAGPQGPAGAAGAQGPPVTFTGGWLTGKVYALGDAVSYGGSSYIALTANSGRQPDVSPIYWGMLAAVGSTGPAGATGAQGLQGPTGYPGPTGAAGATGAAGPAGPAGPAGATGPAGVQGIAGPQGGAGLAGLAYRGTYSSSVSYGLNDGVVFGGSLYISLGGSNAGNTPGLSPAAWAVLAAAGAPGATGAAGVNGRDGATGATGPAGPAGPQGVAGAAGANGAAGLVYRGAYGSGTNYALNDAVTYNGSSFISLVAGNHGNAPDQSVAAWSLLASAGVPGQAGLAGAAGPQGTTGAQGPSGPQGPAGATGAAGINFRGPWVTGSGYAVNDAVTLGGATYLAQMSNASVRPDTNPGVWAVLAAMGQAGPTGAAGSGATVQVGSITTGAPGTAANVTNSGTSSAAVLNFTIPQGATGAGGTGGTGAAASTSGVPYVAMYHAVSYAATYYSVNNTNQGASETASVLTWVPGGCSATRLDVFSQQAATITVTLRTGSPGAMVDSGLSCAVGTGKSCSATGSVVVPAGGFVDIGIAHPDSVPSGVWVAVVCN